MNNKELLAKIQQLEIENRMLKVFIQEAESQKPVAWLSSSGHWTVSLRDKESYEKRYGSMRPLYAMPVFPQIVSTESL